MLCQARAAALPRGRGRRAAAGDDRAEGGQLEKCIGVLLVYTILSIRAYDLSIRIDVASVDHRNSVTGEVWAQSFGFQTSRTPVKAI